MAILEADPQEPEGLEEEPITYEEQKPSLDDRVQNTWDNIQAARERFKQFQGGRQAGQQEQGPGGKSESLPRIGANPSEATEGIANRAEGAAAKAGAASEKAVGAGAKAIGSAASAAKGAAGAAGAEGAAAALGTAAGGPLGTALGAMAGWMAARFAKKSTRVAVYVIIGICGLTLLVTLPLWAMVGGNSYFGSRGHIQARQGSIDKFLAYSGDTASLRKLIVEEGGTLKDELSAIKNKLDTLELDKAREDSIRLKVDEAIDLVNEASALLTGDGSGISTAAQEKIQRLVTLFNEIREISNLSLTRGDFVLPLGSLTCKTTHNATVHSIAKSGHSPIIRYGGQGGALDYYAPPSTPVRAVVSGYVKRAYISDRDQTARIIIISDDQRYETVYAHISKNLEQGDRVEKGDVIGKTIKGTMRWPHLHFEIWIDGKPYAEKEQLKLFCGGSNDQ